MSNKYWENYRQYITTSIGAHFWFGFVPFQLEFPVADPAFPGGGRHPIIWPNCSQKLHENERNLVRICRPQPLDPPFPGGGDAILLFGRIVPKNCMKMKEIWCVSVAPSRWIHQWCPSHALIGHLFLDLYCSLNWLFWSKGVPRMLAPSWAQFFFHFHAIFGKIIGWCTPFGSLYLPLGNPGSATTEFGI